MLELVGLTLELDHAGGDPSGVCNIKHSIRNLIKDAKDIIQTSQLSSVLKFKKQQGTHSRLQIASCDSDEVFIWCTAEDTAVMNLVAETSQTLLLLISLPTLQLADDLDTKLLTLHHE